MSGDGVKTEKKWYKSKTVWANVAIAALAGGAPDALSALPVGPEGQMLAIALLNVLLRGVTKAPISK